MKKLLIILCFMLPSCGDGTGSDQFADDSDCTACHVEEDFYGNPVLACSNDVPFGVTCYGLSRRE